MNKYEELKELVVNNIAAIRIGEATLDDLEKAVVNSITEHKVVLYHPIRGSISVPKSKVRGLINEGWYNTPADFPPEKPEILTPEQWEICDNRLVHEWGLSLSSFTEDVMGQNKKDPNVKGSFRELFEQVIEFYGDKIVKVDRNNCEIYKRKDTQE